MTHQIYFELDENVSINVLYKIRDDFEQLPTITEASGEIGFYLGLGKEDAKCFAEDYDRYITTICDFDQEDGGSYI